MTVVECCIDLWFRNIVKLGGFVLFDFMQVAFPKLQIALPFASVVVLVAYLMRVHFTAN